MQIMIDLSTESPASLRMAAKFLQDHAHLKEAAEAGQVPMGTQPKTADELPPNVTLMRDEKGNIVYDPADPAFKVPTPPAPPPPVAHSTVTVSPPATQDTQPFPAAPPPPLPISQPNEVVLPPAVDEFDKAGVPWDARIHQKTRHKKQDGTWKIQRGMDSAVVAAVMQELAPRIRLPGTSTPPAVGASAPVTLPQTERATPQTGPVNSQVLPRTAAPPAPNVPPPPANQGQETPPAPSAPPVPAPPNSAPSAYRALIAKINEAKKSGKLTQEEMMSAVSTSGCPNLQMLFNMPDLIPDVEAKIDAILLMR